MKFKNFISNFFQGMGSIFNIAGNYNMGLDIEDSDEKSLKSDRDALKSDWDKVLKDFKKVK